MSVKATLDNGYTPKKVGGRLRKCCPVTDNVYGLSCFVF